MGKMRARVYLIGFVIFSMAIVSCETMDEFEPVETDNQENIFVLKSASLDYDNFIDSLNWYFTDTPAIPEKPGARLLVGNSSDGRWARVSWKWSACPLYPSLATVSNGILKLQVPGNRQNKGAQIETIRDDYRYGSYRAKFKAGEHSGSLAGKKAAGTVNSFFFYDLNTQQEIDVEVLNKEYDQKKVHFATHPGAWNYVHTLPVDPTDEFIEYGFDVYANKVEFFVNGVKVPVAGKPFVPTTSGKIILNHWTGNPNWGGIAPPSASNMLVDYIKHVPFLQLTFPADSGISLSRSVPQTITWEKYGDVQSYPVDIELWKDGVFYQGIAGRIPNSGNFVWNIPVCVENGDNYQLKIKSFLNSNYSDLNDIKFSIY
jgi:hypothetical protein